MTTSSITPEQRKALDAQARQFAMQIAGLLDGADMPITVALSGLVIAYRALAAQLDPNTATAAAMVLGSAAGELLQRATDAGRSQSLH